VFPIVGRPPATGRARRIAPSEAGAIEEPDLAEPQTSLEVQMWRGVELDSDPIDRARQGQSDVPRQGRITRGYIVVEREIHSEMRKAHLEKLDDGLFVKNAAVLLGKAALDLATIGLSGYFLDSA
jgi:hypothetical protein